MSIRLTIPTSWNQLTPVQLGNVAFQLHCYQQIIKDTPETVNLTSAKLYLEVAKELLRGNGWRAVQKALKEIRPMAFISWSKFIYQRVDRTKYIPFVKVGGVKYYPPAQRLRNITIGEFAFVDAVWYQWRETQKPIWLNVFCAALYREQAEEPNELDNRRPFVKQSVDARADIFSKLSLKQKLAIDYTYEGCRNHIADTYPLIFPKPVEREDGTPPKKQKYTSFGKIVMEKLNGDPSKLETTNNVLANDFLNIMTLDIQRINKNKFK